MSIRRRKSSVSAGKESSPTADDDGPMAPSPPRGGLKVALLSPRAAALQAPPSAGAVRRSLKDKVMQLNSESEQLSQKGKLDEADARLRQAHNFIAEANDDDLVKVELLAITLNNIGLLCKKQRRLDEAVTHLQMCSDLEGCVINFEKKSVTQINLASALLANSQYAQAAVTAKAALQMLFAKFADGADPNRMLRKDLVQFSSAWLLLAKANHETFLAGISSSSGAEPSSGSDQRTAEAHQVLNEYRNAAHAGKTLLGEDDASAKVAMEAYAAAKTSFAQHVPVAIKSLAGLVEAAFPGDEVAMASPRGHVRRASDAKGGNSSAARSRTEEPAGSPLQRGGSARRRSQSSFDPNPNKLQAGSGNMGKVSPRGNLLPSVGDAPLQMTSPTYDSLPSSSRVDSAAKRRNSRLVPLQLDAASADRRAGSRLSSAGSQRKGSSSGSPSDGSPRFHALPPVENGQNYARKLNRSGSQSEAGSPLLRSGSIVKQPLPIANHGRFDLPGLQLVFGVAEEKKINFVVLRFIYFYCRETIAMFPTYRLSSTNTLTQMTSGQAMRLEAAEREATSESAAKRIIEQREKIRKQKEADLINRDMNTIVLDQNMTRRVNARATRQRALFQAAKVLLASVTKSHHRMRFREWKQHAVARKKYRPLRRSVGQILKRINQYSLRITWVRWFKFIKMVRQRIATGQAKPRDFEGRRQALAMQELAEAGRQERLRLEEERQALIQKQMEEDRLAEEEAHRIYLANRPKTPPPKIADIIGEEVQTVYDAWYLAETSKGQKGTMDQLDAVKGAFRNTLTDFVTSDHGLADIERIEALSEDDQLLEVEELTKTVSPFLISLVTGLRYHTKANEELVRCLLATTCDMVDYKRIFFDDELMMSVIADHSTQYFTILLTTIPDFAIADQLLLELMTMCTKCDHYLEYVELLLSKDKICKFKSQRAPLAKYWLAFFDRCIPPTSKGSAAVSPSSTTVGNPECRQRIITLLERLSLDHTTFEFPHKVELKDKQTFLSRMCANGDLELVEIYTSVLDEDVLLELLTRKQSDETTCLVSAVKSQNVDLVRYLLSAHRCCGEKINTKVDGFSTLLDIAKAKGKIPEMIALLKQYGAKDEEDDANDSSARMALLDDEDGAKEYLDGLDSNESSGYHMDDALDF